jgi:GT2 family glycosyltransferase
VDDCSDEEHRLEDLTEKFPFLKIIRLEKENKWYVNPCIPFNIGFKEAKGEKIIIQNPECFHADDILSFVDSNLTDSNYLSFACYSINELTTSVINEIRNHSDILNEKTYVQRAVTYDGDEGWYNHSSYRPCGFHFCSAITKKNLEELGGFDERYANGIAFDDDEFLHRLKLKLNLQFVDNYVSVHQWHYSSTNKYSDFWNLWNKNSYLLNNVTKIENKYTANEK